MQRNEQNVLANKTFYFGLTFFLLFLLAPAERKVQSYCARSINIPPLNGYYTLYMKEKRNPFFLFKVFLSVQSKLFF